MPHPRKSSVELIVVRLADGIELVIMASCAGGELMAAHVLGRALPAYAKAFEVGRFDDAAYLQRIEGLAGVAQL